MAEADLVVAGELRRSERAEEVDIARQSAFWTKVRGIAALVAVATLCGLPPLLSAPASCV
ncbi:hypothetical protein MLGJGCBP_06292 [Rhodococcus sp. T7]|uniref:Uncharacterized protein n=2 Tax=Rhodococcus opacus TaxID=37919 RepID=C1BC12_RHOOB|nr:MULTISPECIES: hypothetical protein [Rhodococcus]KAF0957958.1 hypothetical protein MLGJGCBP_09790 [Rhodococcus sp. T7]UOT07891.1 hypothetical protein MPY17_36400 [Rhodococcus opacus]EID75419.1 hypothetical protein W59_27646 [Rhodococcus opacus RKJ300 = JCM 13270]KAF0960563.1 hypothetical protein MLGJGCBP_06292 [Rhodococcus sp. T7]QQZ18633.1 hypothetical protein GO592_41635 [Rhodococcus sp. 21391]